MEALAGLVERVTFHNADTGFCVLRVKARGQRDLVTVVGHADTITSGEWVQMSGSWINDRTYGLQLKAAFLNASPPTTLEGIEKCLGSGMIDWRHPQQTWRPLTSSCRSRNSTGTASARALSAPPACWTRWSFSLRSWRLLQPRTTWPPRPLLADLKPRRTPE